MHTNVDPSRSTTLTRSSRRKIRRSFLLRPGYDRMRLTCVYLYGTGMSTRYEYQFFTPGSDHEPLESLGFARPKDRTLTDAQRNKYVVCEPTHTRYNIQGDGDYSADKV